MKVTLITIIIGASGKIPKGLGKELEDLEIEGQEETIQTTAVSSTRNAENIPEKETVIQIVIGALGKKNLVRGLEELEFRGRPEIIQTL